MTKPVLTADRSETIAEAFSRTAEKYDSFAEDHPHLTRMRERVYSHVMRHVPGGARILELNAGTGTDAVHLAALYIHATILQWNVESFQEKVEILRLHDRVTIEESFLPLTIISRARLMRCFRPGRTNCVLISPGHSTIT
jgi:hypothetical protein